MRQQTGRPSGTLRPPAREKTVRELMSEHVITLSPEDTLDELADRMADERIRHVPIVNREGELVGIVSDRDLVSLSRPAEDVPISVERDLLRRRRIREIMTTDVATADPDQSLSEAAELMLENKLGCLPVVENQRVVGILTESDFVRQFAGRGA